ncbi:DUF2007 domain-containing protein [Algibacter miyuki]|uniref:DUF2007 domain-containing protein n=1 Tax=Algibacter miyuki TaxID=1306933 RepID=A0ABV5GZA5_9FLAO|nr:DUF2007 domain-containing protein [Algibacter miyuki]MDN3666846.1 DUF2007 domain-containing protein [Algibacter miyuki]
MQNYTKVFTGNLTDVQRVFNELGTLNICAIIRAKSKFERINYPGDFNQTLQDIFVHIDELDRALKVINALVGKNTTPSIKTNTTAQNSRRHLA